MKIKYDKIKNILLDIDGTIVFDGRSIDGAVEAIDRLFDMGMNIRLLTNTTGKTPQQLNDEMTALGFSFKTAQIQTAVTCCAQILQNYKDKSCFLLVPDQVEKILGDLKKDDKKPDFVIISDVENRFNYENLNRVFNYIDQGAELIAIQKNLFWTRNGQKLLDSGAFILGIEAATGKQAMVTGKPSKEFFDIGLQNLNGHVSDTIVVGDDISTDILGARDMRSVLVKTGKFKDEQLKSDFKQPTWCIDSIANLPKLVQEQNK